MPHCQDCSSCGKRKFTNELPQSIKRARQDNSSLLFVETLDDLSTCSSVSSDSVSNISSDDWYKVFDLLLNMPLEDGGEKIVIASPARSGSPTPSEFSKTKSDEVLICQLFQRQPGQALDEAFLMRVMVLVFPDEANAWTAQLHCPSSRPSFLEQMCHYKMTESKKQKTKNILFWMLRCLDHCTGTVTGTSADIGTTKSFDDAFGDSIGRVLLHPGRLKDTFRRNPNLAHNLKVSYHYLTYLFHFMSLYRNICFLLLFVSCVEGRGVYHGRTSTCMSVPHMCYRYLIETLGGKKLANIPPAYRLPYEQKFFEYFELGNEVLAGTLPVNRLPFHDRIVDEVPMTASA